MRWIFQIMEGVGIIRFYENNRHNPIKEMLTNLSELRRKIITLFGGSAIKIYGFA